MMVCSGFSFFWLACSVLSGFFAGVGGFQWAPAALSRPSVRCGATAKEWKGFGAKPPPKPKKKKKTKEDESKTFSAEETALAQTLLASQKAYAAKVGEVAEALAASLAKDEVAVLDAALGADECAELRREAEVMHADFLARPPGRNYAVGIRPEQFQRCPRTVALTMALSGLCNSQALAADPRLGALASDPAANMLTCVLGGGDAPRTKDNIGPDDRRLLTLVYYPNPAYVPRRGGRLQLFHENDENDDDNRKDDDDALSGGEPRAGIEPIGDDTLPGIEPRPDRLVAFYSKTQDYAVDKVEQNTDDDDITAARFALTVWLGKAPQAS